jgi:hypothetical protein
MAEELRINITVDNAQAESKFSATANSASKMADSLSGVENAITTGVNPSLSGMITLLTTAAAPLIAVAAVAAAIAGLGTALAFVVSEANAAEKVMGQTNAVIKSTGGVAGVTAEMVSSLAGDLSELTGVEDDVIQASENLTLTFTNISKNIFPQVTATALDLSQAFGMDLQSATIMLDKALQDPIQGLTALRRVGVSFTEAEQNMIKSMAEHGRVAAAQGMILEAVSKQVAGSAEAMGNTVSGNWAKLTNVFKNGAEEIGKVFTPVISAVLGNWADMFSEILKGAAPVFKTLTQASKDLAVAMRTPEMRAQIKELGRVIGEALGTIGEAQIRSFIDALGTMTQLVVAYGPRIMQTFVRIAEAASVVADAIAGIINAIHDLGTASLAYMGPGGVPRFASGTSNFAGGLAMVHRDEVVALPRGASVLSNVEAREALAGGGGKGVTVNGGTFNFIVQGGEADLENISQQIQTQFAMAGGS